MKTKLVQFFTKKSLKVIVPPLVALIVAIAGVYGFAVNEAELTNTLMVVGGLVGGTISMLFANKQGDEDEDDDLDKDI